MAGKKRQQEQDASSLILLSKDISITSMTISYQYCSVRRAEKCCHTLTRLCCSCETFEGDKNGSCGEETPVPIKPSVTMTAKRGRGGTRNGPWELMFVPLTTTAK